MHPGDWHQACHLYREWFLSQFGINDVSKDWLRQSTSFQDTMFLSARRQTLITGSKTSALGGGCPAIWG